MAICYVLACACGANSPPVIEPIEDVSVPVGDEMTLVVRASDADLDTLTFSFSAEDLPDLADRQPPATIEPLGADAAIFRWIPRVADVRDSPYDFVFTVSDGKRTTSNLVRITVRGRANGDAPSFVQPIGSGTTLDLDVAPCIELDVEVNDNDATEVTIRQEEPSIEGAMLDATGPFTAHWMWCPTPDQVQKQDRFYLRLSGDDGKNPVFLKQPAYLIVVLSTGSGMNCPGAPAVITHTPTPSQVTLQDLDIAFNVTDDVGLKSAPLLYWSLTDPGLPPSITAMTPVSATIVAGGAANASYTAKIPNPVASSAPGTSASVYYVLRARDNDDPTGGCNHLTTAPAVGKYKVEVVADGAGGAAACDACTNDVQCGSANDNCILVAGEQRCGTACGFGGACPTGFQCSATVLTSVNGKVAPQCLPTTNTCKCFGPTCTCPPDVLEPNDKAAQAIALGRPVFPAQVKYTGLSICTTNTDWYSMPLVAGDKLVVDLTFTELDSDGDLDIHLYKPDGTTDLTPCSPTQSGCMFGNGQGATSNEHFEWTIAAGQGGTYYVVVQGYDGNDKNAYDIAVTVK